MIIGHFILKSLWRVAIGTSAILGIYETFGWPMLNQAYLVVAILAAGAGLGILRWRMGVRP